MKTCTLCNEAKPLSEFWKDSSKSDGKSSRCRTCKSKIYNSYRKSRGYDKKRYWKNPMKERERHLTRKYGITLNDYNAMFDAQDGRCAICRRSQKRALDVDHCHASGRVRGLLCTNCNRLIGHAGDSEDRLASAIAYLRRSNRNV